MNTVVTNTATPAGNEPELEHHDSLAAFVDDQCNQFHVPGCAVGVLVGDRAYAVGIGVTSVDDPLPVDADTLFLIGSTTKTMTATTIMSLVQEGRLALDDRVVTILPELQLADATARETVTVGQLLDHSAGWRGDADAETGWGDDALARGLDEVVATMPQLFPPGEEFSYNNAAVMIAGRVIERVTGDTYEAAVRARVLEPLGMTDTYFFPWEVVTRRVAVGHVLREHGVEAAHVWPVSSRSLHPAGGAISTVRDQLRYARFHLDGTAAGVAPLSDGARLSMQQPRVNVPSMLSGVGLSWLLKQRGDVRLVTHGGNNANLHLSAFALAPDERFAVTVLTNSRGGTPVGHAVTEWCIEHFLDRAPVPDAPRRPLPPALEEEYVGRYDAGQWRLEVTAKDGNLLVQMVLIDIPEGTPDEVLAAFNTPPSQVAFVAPDVLASTASLNETIGDFVRDGDGKVAWLRYGLRLARRLA